MKKLLLLALLMAPAASAQVRVTGAPVPLTAPGEGLAHPSFSPDGRYVALTTPSYDGLWLRDLRDGTTRQISDEMAAGFGVAWSPDGSALLARVSRYTDEGRRLNAIRLFDAATGASSLLADYTTGLHALPAWNGDGTEAVVPAQESLQRMETGLTPVSGKNTAPALVASGDALVRASDGAEVAVPVEGQAILSVVPSPDGSRVVLHVMGAGLFVANADGSGLSAIGRGEHPTWSPDGSWIAFMLVSDDGHELTGADLYVVRPSGADRTQLTRTADRMELFPVWTPDGTAIAFDDLDAGAIYLLPVAY